MNTAINALVVPSLSSEREFNELVVYGSEEDLLASKEEVEKTLTSLTKGETRSFSHAIEALTSRLVIINRNLGFAS